MIDNGTTSVARTLEALDAEEARYNGQLEAAHHIDEFALLVVDPNSLRRLTDILFTFGWQQFNEATDYVKTGPIRSAYSVGYYFFKNPEKAYRLEVMRMIDGVSPLHAAIPTPMSRQVCTPVHASFKCQDEETYAVARYMLDENGYTLAQQCESTYGRFSYFTELSQLAPRVPYLKPRVNTRD